MHRLFLFVPAIFTALITFLPEEAAADVRYNRPKIDGLRLDWCYRWAANCGKPAADAFCRRVGYPRARNYLIEHNIGAWAPTRVIGTGQVCRHPGCDGFRYVICAQRRGTTGPAPSGNVRRFTRPRYSGMRLDWCREWARNCGSPAAHAYCRRQGYRRAVRYGKAKNIGRFGPTRLIGTNQVCRFPGCDGFTYIDCARTTTGGGGGGGVVPPRNQVRRFSQPRYAGMRLDWCREWARNCGAPAANTYCRRQGYNRAVRYGKANDIGRFGPTRLIGTNQVCRFPGCDGFTYIDCSRRAGGGGVRPTPAQTRTINNPRISGMRLDWCRTWASNCGRPAANAYCRRIGYRTATRWQIAHNIGSYTPTRVIGTGQVCRHPGCDGFRFITCRR